MPYMRTRTVPTPCVQHAHTVHAPSTPLISCDAPPHTQASFARGGLLLADYINAMSTAMCAVKVRDCLMAAMAAHEAARRLPIIRKVAAACR